MRPILLTVALAAAGVGVTMASQEPAGGTEGPIWDGVYTAAQAERGAGRYTTTCATCHGAELEGGGGGAGRAPALTGDAFFEGFGQTTIDFLFDYVSTSMPSGDEGTLSANAYIDLVAFLLSRNDFPAGAEELTPESAVGISIVSKDGPGDLPHDTLARVVGCLTRGEGSNWLVTSATAPQRVQEAGVGDGDATRPLGTRAFPLNFVFTPLDRYEGHRMSVSGLLMGEGGADGINVTIVESVAEACG